MQSVAYKKLFDGSFLSAVQSLKSKPIKVTTSVKLLPFLKTVREKTKEFEEIRIDLCKNLADKGEDGEPLLLKGADGSERYAFSAEAQEKFNEEFKNLLDTVIELPEPSISIEEIKHLEIPLEHFELLYEIVIKE